MSLKPKIVSVKSLQIRQAPPPSEKDFIFLEMHGQVGAGIAANERKPSEAKIIASPSSAERKGFFGWLKGVFGK